MCFPYLLNYITNYIENYQKITNTDVVTINQYAKTKAVTTNESNELCSNNLRFFQNNLGLVFHTTYSCIFHSCCLLLHFPLLHFPLLLSAPAFSTPAFSTRAIYSCYFHSRIFSRPAVPHIFDSSFSNRMVVCSGFLSVLYVHSLLTSTKPQSNYY